MGTLLQGSVALVVELWPCGPRKMDSLDCPVMVVFLPNQTHLHTRTYRSQGDTCSSKPHCPARDMGLRSPLSRLGLACPGGTEVPTACRFSAPGVGATWTGESDAVLLSR